MQRICPACHEKLNTNDHFFCGSCGSVLDSTLISNTGNVKKIIDLDKVTPKKYKVSNKKIVEVAKDVVKITNLQGIIILLAVLFFVGLPTYIFLSGIHTDLLRGLALSKPKPVVITPKQPQANLQTSESAKPLSLVSTTLGYPPLMAYVPYNIDIFVESGDIYNSLKMIVLKDDYYTELFETLSPVTSERVVAYAAIQQKGVSWVLVTPLKAGVKADSFELPAKYTWLYSKVSDQFLLISNDASMIDLSINVASGLEKNINMNPTFVPIRTKVATGGKLAVVALTGEGKKMLSYELSKEIPTDISKLLIEHFKGTNSYLVVKD